MINYIKNKLNDLIQQGLNCRETETRQFGFTYLYGKNTGMWIVECKLFLTTYFKYSCALSEFNKEKDPKGGFTIQRFDELMCLLKSLA